MLTWLAPTFTTLLMTSSNTVELLQGLIYEDIATVRINDAFTNLAYRTDFIEKDIGLLGKIFDLGKESFGAREVALRNFFDVS